MHLQRRHLANVAVNLETHIQDVTSVLEADQLEGWFCADTATSASSTRKAYRIAGMLP